MKNHTTLLLWIIFILAGLLRLYWVSVNLTYPLQNIQQDRYADYAYALTDGSISAPSFTDFDKRLLPAYPWLIVLFQLFFVDAIIAGVVISLLASFGVLYLMWYIYRQVLPVFLLAFFPPMWVKQSAKVATEPLFVFFSLLAILFFERKKPFFSGLFIGFTFMIRPIGLTLLAAEAFMLFSKREFKQLIHLCTGFVVMITPLFLYNILVFGQHEVFQQFLHSDRYGGLRLGFIQIVRDISIRLAEGETKLVISGLVYVAMNILSLIILYYFRKKSQQIRLLFYWHLCTLLFILTFSPFTLLGDFGRYALASVPAVVMSYALLLTVFLQKIGFISGRKFPTTTATST